MYFFVYVQLVLNKNTSFIQMVAALHTIHILYFTISSFTQKDDIYITKDSIRSLR